MRPIEFTITEILVFKMFYGKRARILAMFKLERSLILEIAMESNEASYPRNPSVTENGRTSHRIENVPNTHESTTPIKCNDVILQGWLICTVNGLSASMIDEPKLNTLWTLTYNYIFTHLYTFNKYTFNKW